MCSINGFISFNKKIDLSIKDRIKDIIIKAEQRGKDAFGYVCFNHNISKVYQSLERPSKVLEKEFYVENDTYLLLNNNRAEPTTEYIKQKSLDDIQPYSSENCYAVHNGTISNDKEIRKEYNLDTITTIDSAVIPYLFDDIEKYDYDKAITVLRDKLVGSYALAVYNYKTETLYLATNYKPLTIAFDRDKDVLYFSSLEDFIKNDDYNQVFGNISVQEVRPYTMLVIHKGDKDIKSFDLYSDNKKKKQSALICASAGLDSTVAASWAKAQGYDVELLHFDYHCRAASKETKQIQEIAKFLDAKLTTINIDFFRDVIRGSKLTNTNESINKEGGGIAGAELAIEWVPARNLIFMSIAAGYAEAHDIDYIVLGGNLEESGAYADNELIFQQKFNKLLPHALNLQHRVRVLMPVADMMKKDIVEIGLKVNAPLHLTWSCYEDGDLHCGECGPCFMRKTAFKILNQPEVIQYKK